MASSSSVEIVEELSSAAPFQNPLEPQNPQEPRRGRCLFSHQDEIYVLEEMINLPNGDFESREFTQTVNNKLNRDVDLSSAQVKAELKRMKSKFLHRYRCHKDTPYQDHQKQRIFDLSRRVWEEKVKEKEKKKSIVGCSGVIKSQDGEKLSRLKGALVNLKRKMKERFRMNKKIKRMEKEELESVNLAIYELDDDSVSD